MQPMRIAFLIAAMLSPITNLLANDASLAIFEKRILPILQASKPSSCTECHLSGVELKDYIFPEQDKTFAALVKGGMIDVKQPEQSKLLKFIERRPEKPSLITDKVRAEEAAAFREWIQAAVKDPQLLKAKSTSSIGPHVSDELIRHARKDRVLNSFAENVWSEVGRCAACHSPDKNQAQVIKFGDRVSWIKPRDMQGTMQHLLDSGIIDAEAPEKSLLIAKPTLQVEHGGGQKMLLGDRTYKQFRAFIDDYVAVSKGTYKDAKELPKPSREVSQVSEIWLKIEGIPKSLDKQFLRANVYAKTADGWSKDRVATGDRAIFGGGGLWQQHMTLTAPRDSARAKELLSAQKLAGGQYLVRISIDRNNRLAKDPSSDFTSADVVGEVQVRSSWPTGYGAMTVVKFPSQSQ